MHLGRIEFIIVLITDWSFASGCSPPRLSTTQLPSATDRPVLLSGWDFHPPLVRTLRRTPHATSWLGTSCRATIASSSRTFGNPSRRNFNFVLFVRGFILEEDVPLAIPHVALH
jgi:hypothetical protein